MDRYQMQQNRQNEGLPCSDCGSHQGHFSFCGLLNRQAAEVVSEVMRRQGYTLSANGYTWLKNSTMDREADKVRPYMQDEPEFDAADINWLKAMGVTL